MTAPSKLAPTQPSDPADSPAGTCGESVHLAPEQIQAIARALAEPRRFAILQQIAARDSLLCGQLDVQECITPATISHHLKELQEAGLIEVRRQGRQMCLTLRRAVWNAYILHLQQL